MVKGSGRMAGRGLRGSGSHDQGDGPEGGNVTFVLNPAALADPDLAIAASRAGAVGILNAEFSADPAWIKPALERLARFGGPSIGLKLTWPDAAFADLASDYKGHLGYLVVDVELMRTCSAAIAAFRDAGTKIAVETMEWSREVAAVCADADVLWLKGHESGGWVGEQTSFILLQKVAGQTSLPVFVRGGMNERSAAAVHIGGAAGVVLDDQLLLLRESPLAASLAPKLQRFTGTETILLEQNGAGPSLRFWAGAGDARMRAPWRGRCAWPAAGLRPSMRRKSAGDPTLRVPGFHRLAKMGSWQSNGPPATARSPSRCARPTPPSRRCPRGRLRLGCMPPMPRSPGRMARATRSFRGQ